MKKVISSLLIVFVLFGLSSCAVDDNNPEEDVASLYVGEWSYNDTRLGKDASVVSIERISDDEIKIIGFFNLGRSVATRFKVTDRTLEITSTFIDGLAIEGSGTSNYSHDNLNVLFSVDGDDYEANMTKLKLE
jgi:hypothetical protein